MNNVHWTPPSMLTSPSLTWTSLTRYCQHLHNITINIDITIDITINIDMIITIDITTNIDTIIIFRAGSWDLVNLNSNSFSDELSQFICGQVLIIIIIIIEKTRNILRMFNIFPVLPKKEKVEDRLAGPSKVHPWASPGHENHVSNPPVNPPREYYIRLH